jgi:divalent metal cation (Fe/Co/Zn/Cd) transporter
MCAGVVAIVLATEVIRSAVAALVVHEIAVMAWPVLLLFAVKVGVKLVLLVVAGIMVKCFNARSPALGALIIDSRNDIIMGLSSRPFLADCFLADAPIGIVSIAGYFAALYGSPTVDSYLALPCGLWVGWGGIGIVRENVKLLMGEVPPSEVVTEIDAVIRREAGVLGVAEARGPCVIKMNKCPHCAGRCGPRASAPMCRSQPPCSSVRACPWVKAMLSHSVCGRG